MSSGLPSSEMIHNSTKNGSPNCDLLIFMYRYCIYWVKTGESSPHCQNMYGKGEKRVSKAELWPAEVDPYQCYE